MKDKELRQVLHKAGIISYNFGSETYYDKIIPSGENLTEIATLLYSLIEALGYKVQRGTQLMKKECVPQLLEQYFVHVGLVDESGKKADYEAQFKAKRNKK